MTIELTWTHPNGLFATEPYDCMDDALHQKRMYERDGCVVEIEGETEGHPEAAEPPARADSLMRWGDDDCAFNIEVGAMPEAAI